MKSKPDPRDARALEEWTSKDRDVRLQVRPTLEDHPLLGIVDLTELKPIWDALSSHYDGQRYRVLHSSVLRIFSPSYQL